MIRPLARYKNKINKQIYFVTYSFEDFTWLERADKWSISDRVKTSDFYNVYEEDYRQQELNFEGE